MKIEIEKGDFIYTAAKTAISTARLHNCEVSFDFNGISMTVHPLSYDVDIALIYSLKSQIRRHMAEKD